MVMERSRYRGGGAD